MTSSGTKKLEALRFGWLDFLSSSRGKKNGTTERCNFPHLRQAELPSAAIPACSFIHTVYFVFQRLFKRRKHAKLFLYSVTELQGLIEVQPRLLSHMCSIDTEMTKLLELLLAFVQFRDACINRAPLFGVATSQTIVKVAAVLICNIKT